MSVALNPAGMSRAQFFAWAETQEGRWEFDGFAPVAMTGGTLDHNQITQNVVQALRGRLRGSGCRPFGPDAGVATSDEAVRYPDAVVTCRRVDGSSRLVPDPIIVFEVLSPTSGRTDRIVKLREYHAVPSIRRYVILEYASAELTLLSRADGASDWTATALTAADILPLPEIGIEIPVAEFYQEVDLPALPPDEAAT